MSENSIWRQAARLPRIVEPAEPAPYLRESATGEIPREFLQRAPGSGVYCVGEIYLNGL